MRVGMSPFARTYFDFCPSIIERWCLLTEKRAKGRLWEKNTISLMVADIRILPSTFNFFRWVMRSHDSYLKLAYCSLGLEPP